MGAVVYLTVLMACFRVAILADSAPACEIDLECRECIPDHMPLVTSHAARGGRVSVSHGAALRLSCGAGSLLARPSDSEISVVCDAGRYRTPDGQLRHLLELGCQEDVFEDVLHHVEHCGAPLQGRAYQMQVRRGGARHFAALCYDADRAVTRRAHVVSAPRGELHLAPHSDSFAPLTVLGNFNHMFDTNTRKEAEALFADDASANRRLRELLKHDDVTLADQTVTAAKLLSPHYFEDQNARVTDFVSNKVVTWRSVARGNWQHLQHDVRGALRAARRVNATLHVWAGAAGTLALRGARGAARVALRAPERFPAPRHLWTVLQDAASKRAVALVVLNDPFVAVSEIKEAVFCESACSSISWLHSLRRNRNYETPVLGLTFCCSLQNFTAAVSDMPAAIVPDLHHYTMLTDLNLQETETWRNDV